MTVRTRLAPSPTGYLHIGNLRTALYCFLAARHGNGQFVLRVEDTDRTRLVPDAIDKILEVLTDVGIRPDEGVHHDGGFGPYIQSERLDLYTPRLHKLCEEGSAYYCFCTSDRLELLKKEQEELRLPPRYDGCCRHIPYEDALARVQSGENYTIRLKVPKAQTLVFQDLIRGRIEFNTSEIDDSVLLKSDGFPTYHGAVVIDDDLMKITHVMRGEEWISSMPKQILTARALGITLPEYAHLPSVLGNDGKKLSKRTGDAFVSDYLAKGYIPSALLNFIALLGWHPKQDREILSLDEMIDLFEITDIHKSGAVLDPVKLDWMNGEYIKRMDIDELQSQLESFLDRYEHEFYVDVYRKADPELNIKILRELQTRIKRYNEYRDLTISFYADTVPLRHDLLVNPKMKINTSEEALEALRVAYEVLSDAVDFSTLDAIKTPILAKIAEMGKKNGQILWPIRVALSGEEFSPGAFEMAYILGKEVSLKRIEAYL